jgi:hypothetical protein
MGTRGAYKPKVALLASGDLRDMPQPIVVLALLLFASSASNDIAPALRGGAISIAAPPAQKPGTKTKPSAQSVICSVRTPEAPRGGRLELEGQHFGQTPVVRIAGRVVPRIIERTETLISVQIPADSDGGPVTLSAGSQEASCGTLTIIGKN